MTDIRIVDEPPSVFVVGVTMPVAGGFRSYLEHRGEEWKSEMPAGDPEAVVEAAGRVCYQSWRNPAGRTRQEYIQDQIVGHNHLSVAEHVVVNLLCADVPRSTQLETVRHRVGVAYSWESTRFTDKHLRFVIPPRYRGNVEVTKELIASFENQVRSYQWLKKNAVLNTDEGTPARKRQMEAARAVLPNALGSDGMFTLNGRALRHFVALRTSPAADESMREFAFQVYDATRTVLPHLLADAERDGSEGRHVPSIEFGRK